MFPQELLYLQMIGMQGTTAPFQSDINRCSSVCLRVYLLCTGILVTLHHNPSTNLNNISTYQQPQPWTWITHLRPSVCGPGDSSTPTHRHMSLSTLRMSGGPGCPSRWILEETSTPSISIASPFETWMRFSRAHPLRRDPKKYRLYTTLWRR